MRACRLKVAQALNGSGADVNVKCSESDLGGVHQEYEEMLSTMEHTKFCLALSGDSQSTRRLSEIFLAGTVPNSIAALFAVFRS